MEALTQVDGNILIAEFMGIKFNNGMWFYNGYGKFPSDLSYHSSWDWLIPVIDKIMKVCKSDSDAHYWWNNAPVSDIRIFRESKEDTRLAVIQFIKFYNQTKTT